MSLTTPVLTTPPPTGVANASSEFHCVTGDLLGPLGLIVQGILAFLAFTCLILKRQCEPKNLRRPWRIWFYDTSKQALGACVIHFANVFLADVFQGDPCTWYFVSFLLDSTVGLLVIYIGLKISQCIVIRRGNESLLFGEYGPTADCGSQCNAWMGQCGLYILVMLIEKILITLLLLFNFWKQVRDFLMSPIKDAHVELIIVMFIVPLIVNAIIFWVVDNFLMKRGLGIHPHSRAAQNGSTNGAVRYHKTPRYYGHRKMSESDSDILLSHEDTADIHEEVLDVGGPRPFGHGMGGQLSNGGSSGGRYHLLDATAPVT